MDESDKPMPAKILRGLKNEQFNEDDIIVLKALITGEPTPQVIIVFNVSNILTYNVIIKNYNLYL